MPITIDEIKAAASHAGVTPLAVKRVVDRFKGEKPPLWCAHYAYSQLFASKPRFGHDDSCRYADEMFANDPAPKPAPLIRKQDTGMKL